VVFGCGFAEELGLLFLRGEFFAFELFEEELGGTFSAGEDAEFDGKGEDAVLGIECDVLDDGVRNVGGV
jgi:hypothetical protein